MIGDALIDSARMIAHVIAFSLCVADICLKTFIYFKQDKRDNLLNHAFMATALAAFWLCLFLSQYVKGVLLSLFWEQMSVFPEYFFIGYSIMLIIFAGKNCGVLRRVKLSWRMINGLAIQYFQLGMGWMMIDTLTGMVICLFAFAWAVLIGWALIELTRE